MRNYAKVPPSFWTNEGKRFKKEGPEILLVALYLLTCPASNMIGLFYLPVEYIAHETGIPLEGASEALQRLSEGEFLQYDADAEMVWIIDMAKSQVGAELKPNDKQISGIHKLLYSLPETPLIEEFFEKYEIAFYLEKVSL